MRVLIITLSFALVVLGGKFLVKTENGENYYGAGSPRRYGGGAPRRYGGGPSTHRTTEGK